MAGQSSFNFQIDPDLNQKKKARRRKTLVSASVFVSMTSWLDGKKGLGRRLSAASVAKIVSGVECSTRHPWKIRFRGNWSFRRNFWIRFKRNALTFLPFSFFFFPFSLSLLFAVETPRRGCCSTAKLEINVSSRNPFLIFDRYPRCYTDNETCG